MLKFIKRNVRIIKSFPFIKFNRAFQPSLVIVEDLEHICRTDVEILLYQKLRRHMYYPTPHYRVNHIVVNIALIPFRVALIEQHNGVDEKQLKKYLNRKGWSVIFYNPQHLIKEEQHFVNRIVALTKNHTQASL